jgi:carbamoyltransferase
LLFSEHHLSHAASAYFPSPFDSAAILTIDGVGEWTTTSVAVGNKNNLTIKKEIKFPHSLGLLYSAFTYYTGFKVNSGEYKIMGLAPYGNPKYYEKIKKHLIKIHEDGSFYLDMKFFNYATGLTMTNKNFDKLFDGPPRKPESKITQREMDLAASVQKITEEIVLKIATHIAKETKEENLCLAGGVALNCVANGVLQRHKIFKNIWIQPASGDAGCALGAALAVHHIKMNYKKNKVNYIDLMQGSYLGPRYNNNQIKKTLVEVGAKFHSYSNQEMIKKTAKGISEGNAIGWMQGRMEFGPRALGSRSIIGDPRSPKMQKQLNLKVKYRESFRPFAPSILSEKLTEWFELKENSPYMLLVDYIKKDKRTEMSDAEKKLFGIEKLNISRSKVPAVTHVDYSSRIQTVHKKTNPVYHALLTEFNKISGCPIVVNTSFNVRGEPIVCTPLDAFKCFMGTEMDILAIGDFILYKNEQNPKLKKSYKSKYKLD